MCLQLISLKLSHVESSHIRLSPLHALINIIMMMCGEDKLHVADLEQGPVQHVGLSSDAFKVSRWGYCTRLQAPEWRHVAAA